MNIKKTIVCIHVILFAWIFSSYADNACDIDSNGRVDFQGYNIDSMKRDLANAFELTKYGATELNREHPNLAKKYISKMQIFELKSYPGLIFKSDRRGKRSENRLKCMDIINRYELDSLIIPESINFNIEVNGVSININVEEKLQVTGLFQETKDAYLALFSKMEIEPELYEQLEKLFSQLAIFVYETGFWDVGYSNIPLLINNEVPKIVLVDLNDLFDEDAHKFHNYKKEGILKLLERVHKKFHDAIVNSAAQHSGSTNYEVMHSIKHASRDCDHAGKCRYNYKPYSYDEIDLRYEMDGMM